MRILLVLAMAFCVFSVAFVLTGTCERKPADRNYEELKESNLKKYEALQLYWAYEKAVENLLDKLDSVYKWTDVFEDDDYYQAKYRLDSLYWEEC